MRAKIYFEGGGKGKASRIRCRRALSQFIEKTGLPGGSFSVVPCGPRGKTFRDFKVALFNSADTFPLLLVDSETAVTLPPWEHLRNHDGWTRPPSVTDEQAHLMIQCMEAWFLADLTSLEKYFGPGFQTSSLPTNPNPETVPKKDVLNKLRRAAANTRKGKYQKGMGFDILSRLNPQRVRKVLRSADRFLRVLRSRAAA